jgi:hypothetical protein
MNMKDSEVGIYKTGQNAFEERNYRAYFVGAHLSTLVISEQNVTAQICVC